MRMLGWVLVAFAAVVSSFGSRVEAASTGAKLLRVQGNTAGTASGDYVSDTGGQNTSYHFWVEVPPSLGSLQIDIFDADFGVGGAAEGDADRDRLRGGAGGTTTYRLFQPDGTEITTASTPALAFNTGSATLPAGANNAWLNFYTRANPPAGHWEVRLTTNAGNDVNAFGLRAHDGTSGAGGTELTVYADSEYEIGVNPPATGTRTSSFTMYPYVTSGCTANHQDFDYDSGTVTVVGGVSQSATYTNRDATWTSTIANAGLSGDNVWVNSTLPNAGGIPPAGGINSRTGMGLWTATYVINETAGPAANFSELIVSADGSTATPTAATGNPPANTFRVYFPNDAGAKPSKPYLRQGISRVSGATPPAVGSPSRYGVSVSFINDGFQAVTFANASSRWIQAVVPNVAGLTYVANSAAVTQGTVNASPGGAPGTSTTRTIRWDPGTVAAGVRVDLYYELDFTPTAAGTINMTGAGNTNALDSVTMGTRADFLDNTGNAAQARAIFGFGGLCPLQITIGTAVPTPVTLSWLNAKRTGAGVDVRWATDTEVGNLGFNVYGQSGGQWIKLNNQPIPSHRPNSSRRQKYAISLVAPSDVSRIQLEDISAKGTRVRHGAVELGGENGSDIAMPTTNWAGLPQGRGTQSVTGAQAGKMYVDVNADGIWRIRIADAAAAGVDLSSVSTSAIALVGSDGPVPLRILNAAGSVLGSGAVLEFYGRARDSVFGRTNTYLLSIDPANARRMREANGSNLPWDRQVAWYWETSRIARQSQYSFASPTASPWIDSELFAPGASAEASYNLVVDSAWSLDNASIGVNASGQDDFPGRDDDHRLRVEANGVLVRQLDFPGIREERMRFNAAPGQLNDGSNTVRLSLPADQGVEFDLVDINSVDILYQRRFVARGGILDASLGPVGDSVTLGTDVLFRDQFGDSPDACGAAECAAVVVSGVSTGAHAYAVDGSQAVHFADAAASGGTLRVVSPVDGNWRLLVNDPTTTPVASLRQVPAPADVSGPPSELLIVAHPDFVAGLSAFATAKANAGISTRVVAIDSVYAKYSGGRRDPEALRRLFADAYAGGTRYGLLVGGDSYDYDNNLGTGAISFVPTTYTRTSEVMQWTPSDPLLGDIDGDGLPEVAIGRWPVHSTADLNLIVQRTLDYAAGPAGHRAILAAGGSCDPGTTSCQPTIDFTAMNGKIRDAVAGQGWATSRIEVDALGRSAANVQLIGAFNSGPSIVTYVGHSSPWRWSFDPLLTQDDVVAMLNNASKPTVVAQWSCWTTYFVDPASNSIGQSLLFDGVGGAAAVIGATGLVDVGSDDPFVTSVMRRATSGVRLGDALDQTRRQFANDSPRRLDMINGVSLLGDPTLVLH